MVVFFISSPFFNRRARGFRAKFGPLKVYFHAGACHFLDTITANCKHFRHFNVVSEFLFVDFSPLKCV